MTSDRLALFQKCFVGGARVHGLTDLPLRSWGGFTLQRVTATHKKLFSKYPIKCGTFSTIAECDFSSVHVRCVSVQFRCDVEGGVLQRLQSAECSWLHQRWPLWPPRTVICGI
jgi:hypothetical protein